jgi:hypothetical protein
MSPFQQPFDRLKGIEVELGAVQTALHGRLANTSGADHVLAEASLAQSERTYLIRLLAEFEGSLTDIAPSLSAPIAFGPKDGLAFKLDQLGANLNIN